MKPNKEVTEFLDALAHPLRDEIEQLRTVILGAGVDLDENIKWNGPNYVSRGEDRITMKIQPPKNIQLIFHRGAKKLTQPKSRLIEDKSGLLSWKENDRAVATFTTREEIKKMEKGLKQIVKDWVHASKGLYVRAK